MKRIFFVLILYISGCGVFNPGDKYNPNYTPKPAVEESLINYPDTIMMVSETDTMKMVVKKEGSWPVPLDTLKND